MQACCLLAMMKSADRIPIKISRSLWRLDPLGFPDPRTRALNAQARALPELRLMQKRRAPDTEVDAAISPGLARVPGSMKILISSVHKRTGLLYQRYRDYFGRDNDDVLVVYGTTLQFNPSFDQSLIEKALAEDPERYGAEYLSKWRDDLSTWLSRELLDAAVVFSSGRLPGI
jgi:hypothetical protein